MPKTAIAPITFESIDCTHPKAAKPFTITVKGCRITLKNAPFCPECSATYLDSVATVCGACKTPILPDMPVALNGCKNQKKHPYTHLNRNCCPSGGLYCGTWGEGELMTLHELDPKKFPAGSASIAHAVVKTGKTIVASP